MTEVLFKVELNTPTLTINLSFSHMSKAIAIIGKHDIHITNITSRTNAL